MLPHARRKGKVKNYESALIGQVKAIIEDRLGMIGLIILVFFVLVAIFAPWIAPYGPYETVYRSGEIVAKLDPPSLQYWFGTTSLGEDVFSQTVLGTRLALFVGFISALFITLIGTNIGLIAGYCGRWVDDLLMRITDIAYGIPFEPFGIVLVSVLGANKWNIIVAIAALLWRGNARIIRSQILSLRERPFVWSAKASGASHLRVLYIHIAPNILPLALLSVAYGVGRGITAEAGLSFVGLGDPAAASWGKMLYFAFCSGAMRMAWWWVLPPGLCIGLLVVSCYLLARAYESVVNPKLREM